MESPHCVLETAMDLGKNDLSHEAMMSEIHLQHFDHLEDASDDDHLCILVQMVNHQLSTPPQKIVANGWVSVTKDHHA